MTKDPVCGMQINEADVTETSKYHGKTYYFCSKQCKDNFDKDPAKYTHAGDDTMGGHHH